VSIFRFEVHGDFKAEDYIERVVGRADELACFGWIQKSNIAETIVGEARCSKKKGPKLHNFITTTFNEEIRVYSNVKVYEDTKIFLHFSSFKVLEDDRNTCFLDHPHKCVMKELNENENHELSRGEL